MVHEQGVVALQPADLGLLVMQLDLSPHTTRFHFAVIGCPDSRGYEVILVDELCVGELELCNGRRRTTRLQSAPRHRAGRRLER